MATSVGKNKVTSKHLGDELKVVIYARFSSEMQDKTSLRQQQRNARHHLDKVGIAHHDAVVIEDAAKRGHDARRPGYQQLLQMIQTGEVDILVVNELSRLGRGLPTTNFIKDLQFYGGRFISVAEDIDTNRDGWEINSRVSEMNSSVSMKFHAHRIRAGLEDRVLDGDGSAGDYPIGYKTTFADPDWAEKLGTRRRPKKVVIIDETTKPVVEQIYQWYALEGESMNEICRRLNRRKAPKGPKARTDTWEAAYVAQILENEKYIGRWPWGATRGFRHSSGKERRMPRPENEQTIVDRKHLRLIDQETWDKAQERRECERKHYSRQQKELQKEPYVHPRHLSPQHSLAGLVRCAHCGHPLGSVTPGAGRTLFYCRNQIYDACDASRRTRVACVEATIIRYLRDFAARSDGWIEQVWTEVCGLLEAERARRPSELVSLQKAIEANESKTGKLLAAIETVGKDIPSITDRLSALGGEHQEMTRRLAMMEADQSSDAPLPTLEEIKERVRRLPDEIMGATEPSEAAQFYRRLFSDIELVQPARGDINQPVFLQLRPCHQALLECSLNQLSRIDTELFKAVVADPETITLQVEEPQRAYHYGPKMHQYRLDGWTWGQIADELGLSKSQAHYRYCRWRKNNMN